MSTSIPVLETDRLRLREHRLDDLDAAAAMWSEPAVVRFIGGKPSTRQRTWERIQNYRGHWILMGFGFWAVEEKATGRFVGELGFADFKREIQGADEFRGLPEIGWTLSPSVHGKGYSTEALRAAVAWGDRNLPKSAGGRSFCIIDPPNEVSIRVATKLGYRERTQVRYLDSNLTLFERRTN